MPKMIICDKLEDVEDAHLYSQVEYPGRLHETLEQAEGDLYIVVASEDSWGLRYPNLHRWPAWQFERIITQHTSSEIVKDAKLTEEVLKNYEADYSITFKTSLEIEFSDESHMEEPCDLPERVLILADKTYAYQLKGTLLTSSGKSFKTAGRNPFIYKAKDIHKARKSKRDIVLVEVDSFDGWDVPDLLDEFKVVIFSEDEVALPSCEGLPGYFELDSEGLGDNSVLDKLYSFLDYTRE